MNCMRLVLLEVAEGGGVVVHHYCTWICGKHGFIVQNIQLTSITPDSQCIIVCDAYKIFGIDLRLSGVVDRCGDIHCCCHWCHAESRRDCRQVFVGGHQGRPCVHHHEDIEGIREDLRMSMKKVDKQHLSK